MRLDCRLVDAPELDDIPLFALASLHLHRITLLPGSSVATAGRHARPSKRGLEPQSRLACASEDQAAPGP